MRKLSVAHIDAHMSDLVGRSEKNQVGDAQVAFADCFTDFYLGGGGARQTNVEQIAVDTLNKSGAVNAAPAIAAQLMRCSAPMCDHGIQSLFDGR